MTHVSAVFLGDTDVGKTTFLTRACEGSHTHKLIKPTIGVDNIVFYNEKDVVRCWDTSGSKRFLNIIPLFVRRCDIAVFVFDVERPDTYKNIARWNSLVCNCEDSPDEKIIIALKNKTEILPSSYLGIDIVDGSYPREVMKEIFHRGLRQKQHRASFDIETHGQQPRCCFSLC